MSSPGRCIHSGEFVTGSGRRMPYEYRTAAKQRGTIVAIHGAGCRMDVWKNQMPLAEML